MKIAFLAVVFGFVYVLGFLKPFGVVGNVLLCALGSFVIVKMRHWLKGS